MTAAPHPHSTPAPLSFIPHALAVLWLGLMAGFFGTYSANVNLALLQMDGASEPVQDLFGDRVGAQGMSGGFECAEIGRASCRERV